MTRRPTLTDDREVVIHHPRHITGLLRIVREPMHPQFNQAVRRLIDLRDDPTVSDWYLAVINERLAQIERLPSGTYNPGPEVA